MRTSLNISPHHTDYYGVKVIFVFITLLFFLAYTSFYLIQNYYSKSFLEYSLDGKKIYFLKSDTLKKMYETDGMDYEAYQKRVKYFKDLCLKYSYDSKDIYSYGLSKLDKNAKLIILDMMSLSSSEIDDVDKFVINGGHIIFNFTSGFLNTSLKYQRDNLVSRIAALQLDEHENTIRYDKNSTGYITTRLLSPLSNHLQNGRGLELVLYDPLPIFDTPSNLEADAYLTNWSQDNYLTVSKKRELSKKESGLVWHGYKGKGKWIYFSFPSYSFMEATPKIYANLFKDMLEYLDKDIIPIAYPYIDTKNIIFVSEDTEYKFENLKQLYDVAKKNKFPVTAFCVANLAQEHKSLVELAAKSKYVEIASHSYTHKQIVGKSDEVYEKETQGSKIALDKLSKKKIYGFRPPREEIDDKMIHLLNEGGFKYILGAGEDRLTPYFINNIMIIPRHGTDDYSYFVNLDWDSKEILRQMKHEANIVCDLNGIYTLSTHTHLMTYSSNIKIVDDFFRYINSKKDLHPMNGKMIFDRVSQRAKIGLHTNTTVKKLVMTFTNDNLVEVKNIHYELYVDPNIRLKSIESEIIGVKTELLKVSSLKYTLIIKSMKPRSQIVLFVNYAQNI